MKKKIILFLFYLPLAIIVVKAQIKDPLEAKNSKAQQVWVDSILNKMTIDEKIGQLFMIQAYSNKDDNHEAFIINMINKYHIGNLIFMQGTPEKQVLLTNKYQKLAKIPLLIGFDGEWGLDMRLKNSYRFPWNMTLGAVQDKKLIEDLGKHIGKHCKRIGININFAPVADINTNPKNPIIGNRSFGETRENVAEKTIAFTKGMQSQGVLASAKHFPGHGDTKTDSHNVLPMIGFAKKRIDSLELYPFKKQIEAGITSVMTAHLSVPSLEPDSLLPSSLSKNIVTNLLQNQLKFKGLIFTDGLNMKGVANYSTAAKVNLAAILAGNDILLIPQDVPNTFRLLKKSFNNGTLSEERINKSVKKILKAKYLAGLYNFEPISTENLSEDINSASDEVLHRKLVENSITLLKNTYQTIPVKNLSANNIAYVKLGDAPNDYFVKMLKNYTKVDVVSGNNINSVLKKLEDYNIVIIGFHKSDKNPWQSYRFSKKDLTWLQAIAKENRVVLNVFASPYSLLQIKSFKNIDNIVVSYQNSKISQELSAQAIFGAVVLKGKLPVSVGNNFSAGDGLVTYNLHRLRYGIPEEVGMSSKKLLKIDSYADTILNERMSPGLQLLVARNGKVVYNKSFGYHTYSKREKVKESDLYDLASITKILASLPMVMKANEEKQFSLYSSLKEVLPDFKNTNKDTLQIKEILSHNGRLIPWIPFYRLTKNERGNNSAKLYSPIKTSKFNIKVANKLYLLKSYKDSILARIKEVNQRSRLGYRYSDLGYYILKEVIEKKYHDRLDELVSTKFYEPLGLNRTAYLPLEKFKKQEIIPTERDTYFRNQLVHGYVHDMGAAMQGGVGGHAGLFANANDVAKMMQMYLQKGYYGGKRYFKPETIDIFNKRYFEDFKNRRGVGFDKPQINPKEKATCGCVSEHSFGHSGFTGTYTWADPDSGILYVFLSNRVFPTMRNKKMIKSNVRIKIQKVIQDAIIN